MKIKVNLNHTKIKGPITDPKTYAINGEGDLMIEQTDGTWKVSKNKFKHFEISFEPESTDVIINN